MHDRPADDDRTTATEDDRATSTKRPSLTSMASLDMSAFDDDARTTRNPSGGVPTDARQMTDFGNMVEHYAMYDFDGNGLDGAIPLQQGDVVLVDHQIGESNGWYVCTCTHLIYAGVGCRPRLLTHAHGQT